MAAWKFHGETNDPVQKRRRQLEEQQRRLLSKINEIQAKLQAQPPPLPPKPLEAAPPVWRLEEEDTYTRHQGPLEATRSPRVLRAQRQKDFLKFLAFFVPLALTLIWLLQRLLS